MRKFGGYQRDGNEPEMVDLARDSGYYVERVDSAVGFPDLVLVKRSNDAPVFQVSNTTEMKAVLAMELPMAAVEVKMPKGKLRQNQELFFNIVRGLDAQ
jgi:hypothetical protein